MRHACKRQHLEYRSPVSVETSKTVEAHQASQTTDNGEVSTQKLGRAGLTHPAVQRAADITTGMSRLCQRYGNQLARRSSRCDHQLYDTAMTGQGSEHLQRRSPPAHTRRPRRRGFRTKALASRFDASSNMPKAGIITAGMLATTQREKSQLLPQQKLIL